MVESVNVQNWNKAFSSLLSSTEPSEPQFLQLADQLTGLGMAREAATARSWTYLPPSQQDLRNTLLRWDGLIRNPLVVRQLDSRSQQASLLQHVQELADQSRLDDALYLLETLARQNAFAPHLCNKLGFLYEQRGDHWMAERWYRTSLNTQPLQLQTWLMLASVLLKQHAADEALECVQKALNLHVSHPWGLKLQARALEHLRSFPRTTPQLQSPGPMPLSALMLIRSRLAQFQRSVWAIGPGSLSALFWLEDLVKSGPSPPDLTIIACSPEPAIQDALTSLGFHVKGCLPLYHLANAEPPGLLVLSLEQLPGCPRLLSSILIGASTAVLHRSQDLILNTRAYCTTVAIFDDWVLSSP
jgi:tetratricopeptide (TPR) repeat protein